MRAAQETAPRDWALVSKWFIGKRAAVDVPEDFLPLGSLLRLLGVMAIVTIPHVPHLPLWIVIGSVMVVIWRIYAAKRHWRMLPFLPKAVLASSVFAGVFFNFGHISGQTAGVALLCAMSALKLTELRSRRDVMFLVFLLYFMLITHFLFSQDLWTIGYLLLCTVLITALLTEISHAGRALAPRISLKIAGKMVAQALPLMVVMFVLFPRIPGPLWGIPADAGAARSGLSDSMSPGDIAHLLESDALAFRVRFFADPPLMRDRYWRGPVFDTFDGRRWSASGYLDATAAPTVELGGRIIDYEVTLEPTNQSWLYALELPAPTTIPPDAHLNGGEVLATKDAIRDRRLYRMSAHSSWRFQTHLDERQRDKNLRLPHNSNPKTQALGQSWKAEGLAPEALVSRALHWFHDENFVYTLEPPRLQENPVDQFLFETRRGFCEHYASAFTVLMRAAGVPARIVTGYQGGEANAVGDYYVVRQSDAHAWAEVWLEGMGWKRVDPTAAVAPERIEAGISEALLHTPSIPGHLSVSHRASLEFAIAARWDWVNAQWDRWVLGYGPELQHDLLAGFGLDHMRYLLIALTGVVTLFLSIIGYAELRRFRDYVVPIDEATRLWRRLQSAARSAGVPPQPGEGAFDFTQRLAMRFPESSASLSEAARLYHALRYEPQPPADGAARSAARLKTAIAQIRLRPA